MDPNRLTQKAQEALAEAQNNAVRYGHREIDGEHLLLALCQQDGGLIPRLLEKVQRPADVVVAALERDWEPRRLASGSAAPGGEAGNPAPQ